MYFAVCSNIRTQAKQEIIDTHTHYYTHFNTQISTHTDSSTKMCTEISSIQFLAFLLSNYILSFFSHCTKGRDIEKFSEQKLVKIERLS